MNITHDGSPATKTKLPASDKLKKILDITGQKFGRLLVVRLSPNKKPGQRSAIWECRCDCGKTKEVRGTSLRFGTSRSCGCWTDEHRAECATSKTTHGRSDTSEYHILGSIIARCTNPNQAHYADYGGRGITFDPRWRDPVAFFNDIATLGPRPEGWSIDRIENSGNYVLGNIRWAPRSVQNRNKRSNINITFNGKTQCLFDWAAEIGIAPRTLWWRIKYKKWSTERALTEKARPMLPYSRWNRATA